MFSIVLLICIFSSFFLLFFTGVVLYDEKKKFHQRKALHRATKTFDALDEGRVEFVQKTSLSRIESINAVLLKIPFLRTLALLIQKAGLTFDAFTVIVVCAGSFIAGYILLRYIAGMSHMISLLAGALAAVVPIVYITIRIRIRREKFEEYFVDTLASIKNALQAGQGLVAALQIAGEESRWPVNEEIQKVMSEINFGASFDDALQGMGKRIKLDELHYFISSIGIQRQSGGNLSTIIANIERTIRSRYELKREMRAMLAQGKMTGYVLVGMPFVMVLVLQLVNPEYLSPLFQTELGLKILTFAIIWEVFGILWIKKIVSIKY